MGHLSKLWLLACLLACGSAAWSASVGEDPYIGYVYPAGGQQGTVFRAVVAGQRLRAASDMYVSGKGVRGSLVQYQGPSGPLSPAQQQELRRRLEEIRASRGGRPNADRPNAKKTAPAAPAGTAAGSAKSPAVALPDLPELRNLEQQTGPQLLRIVDKFLNNQKRPKAPIAEEVTLEVTVDPDAAPGNRELRLRTPAGLTNPLVFQVGQIPEIREPDKDDTGGESAGPAPALHAPVVLNGQIMPGEVDRFPLELKAGQRLLFATEARSLIPYLADAVPGWFQAVAALYDADGKELVYANECGFDPDPAFAFKVLKDGQYTFVIRDALYRGRQDFIYRVHIGEESLLKSLFPLGSRGGVPIGDTRTAREQFYMQTQAYFQSAGIYFPQSSETEPNGTGRTAMPVTLPHIVNGAIAAPGDKDVYRFDGRAGDQVVAEVLARRMGSPLDSLLRLIDAKGKVVAWNDDYEDVKTGLLTHQADSDLSAKLPATGRYFVQVSDVQGHGGPEYFYSLRIGPPRPDFALMLVPSGLNVMAGRSVLATVYAMRKDGWDGDIEVSLKDAPAGFVLSGGRIPKGRDHVRMTLTSPRGQSSQPISLQLEGRAQIGGRTVVRPVVPAEDMMQAFAYHHLVPSDQLLVTVVPAGPRLPTLEVAGGDPLRLPAGGRGEVTVSMRPYAPNAPIKLDLDNPPAGVTLQSVTATPGGFTLVINADNKHAGYSDNLIIGVVAEVDLKRQNPAAQKQRVSLGVLQAVPFEIVKR